MTDSDAEMMALARLAYERWVEHKEGIIDTPIGPMGLPPWENALAPELELPAEDKHAWYMVVNGVLSAALQHGIVVARDTDG